MSFSRLLFLTGCVLFFCLSAAVSFCQPAVAVLRLHQDAPGVMQYHSQESLPDDSGYTWQVVLFRQFQPDAPPVIYLRLVGFPDIAEFVHPSPLEITTPSNQLLIAPDAFAQEAPAPNVGQYDVTDLIAKLPTNGSLKLSVPLAGEQILSLKIPQSVAVEWQLLTETKRLSLPQT